MLRNLNEGNWVALYGEDERFVKVARVDHKFSLVGDEARTYKKNSIEILMIRYRDRHDKTLDSSGNIKFDYMMIDAATGREIRGQHHDLIIKPVPSCLNIVEPDTSMTWSDIIEKQKLIYLLSDTDWKTMTIADIKEIKSVLERQYFNKQKEVDEN